MSAQPNCSYEAQALYADTSLEINPDIGGIGVHISFVGTAFLSLGLLIFKYIFAHNPALQPHLCRTASLDQSCRTCILQGRSSDWRANGVDVRVLALVRRIARIENDWGEVSDILDKCIINMCDIQVITGHAILFCGFIALRSSKTFISALEWSLITYTAWFSAVTHLSGLIALRSPRYRHSPSKMIRVLAMGSLLVLVGVALLPTGFFNWSQVGDYVALSVPQSPAICYFDTAASMGAYENARADYIRNSKPENPDLVRPLVNTVAFQAMIIALLALVIAFGTRCVKLFAALADGVQRYCRVPLSRLLHYLLSTLISPSWCHHPQSDGLATFRQSLWLDVVVHPAIGLLVFFRFLAEFYSSMLFEIIWMVIAVIWGLLKLDSLRHGKVSSTAAVTAPILLDEWTFGQMMAVALLASPICFIIGEVVALIRARGLIAQLDEPMHASRSCSPDLDPLIEGHSFPRDCDSFELMDATAINVEDLRLTAAFQLIRSKPYRRPSWLSTCEIMTVVVWALTASLAILLTGQVPGISTNRSMTEFWITDPGMLWFVCMVQPVVFAISVAIGIGYRGPRVQQTGPGSNSILKKVLFTIICLGLFGGSTALVYSNLDFGLPPAVELLMLATAFYLCYAMFSIVYRCVKWASSNDL